ncbi:hypothetical protein [Janibacter sp. G1551]|uniref:hypothetical protein n=1 Tax=Janibacter sp. G1551 TaxID=3420440 RepID=UPI003CFCE4FD
MAGKQLPCGLGQGEASSFANRNDADLVSYCYYPIDDRIKVTVRSQFTAQSGKREERTAEAKLGKRLGPCTVPPSPSPTTTTTTPPPSPSPSGSSTTSPTTPPPPPPDTEATVTCGDLDIPITFPGDGGPIKIHLDASDLKDLFDPALAD